MQVLKPEKNVSEERSWTTTLYSNEMHVTQYDVEFPVASWSNPEDVRSATNLDQLRRITIVAMIWP